MDTISIRPSSTPKEREENDEEKTERQTTRQQTFSRKAEGLSPVGRMGFEPNSKRWQNISKGQEGAPRKEGADTDYTLMYGIAAGWDILTFLTGLIPIVGWVVNFLVVFPAGLFNMYLMALGKGKSTAQFWGGFKYIFIEAIPYINVVPTFIRGVYLIKNEGKKTGIAGVVNATNNMLGK